MWLTDLAESQPVVRAFEALALDCVLRLTLGSVKVQRIGLSTSGELSPEF